MEEVQGQRPGSERSHRTKIAAPSQSPSLRVNQTFITWISVAYATSITATSGQYSRGSGAKPNAVPTQGKGKLIPTAQMITVVTTSAELARLSTNGIFVVRMMRYRSKPKTLVCCSQAGPHAYFGFRLRR